MLLHLKFKKGLRPLGFQMRLKTFSVRRLFRWGAGRLLERLRWLECIGTPKANYFALWC